MKKLKVLILASRPIGHGQLFTGKLESALLIPFNGKPLVAHFEDQFKDFDTVYALSEDAFKTHILMLKRYSNRTIITIPKGISNGTTGDCLLYCLEELKFPENILTIHGDNIYEFAEYPEQIEININYTFNSETLHGQYSYYSMRDNPNETKLAKSTNWVNTGAHFMRKSSLIERYQGVSIDALLKDADLCVLNRWVDLGHWDLINRHNVSLHARSFNSISLNSDKSAIKKQSAGIKILSEYEHLSNIPEEFSFLFPRVRSLKEIQGYEIEYWPLKSLSEYLVFWNLDLSTWMKILERLLRLIESFANYRIVLIDSKKEFRTTYTEMLDERIGQYSKECLDILNYDFIVLNELKIEGFCIYSHKLYEDLRRIGERINPSFYHGDLCFGNILYHPESEIIKLIDPKGSLFNGSSNCGDFRYDLAKIFHSVIGEFDYFNWQMFSFSQFKNNFNIVLLKQSNSDALESKFREILEELFSKEICRDVQILSAMLFLTMVPLHSDSSERQKALLIQGLTMLNRIYTV